MEEKRKQQALWEFVLPASLMIGVMGLFVYIGEYLATVYEGVPMQVRQTIKQGIHTGGVNVSEIVARMSAQTALTTFTLLCGILLIVFVEPPSKFWVGSHALRRDKRIVILALVMFIAYVLLLLIPPLRNLFALELLGFSDYLFIALLVVLWVFAVRWAWRAHLLERFLS